MVLTQETTPLLRSDRLHMLPTGSVQWQADLDRIVGLIMKRQLKRPGWWEILESQFTYLPDGGDGGWRGEFWGKLMRGATFIYRLTGDEELYGLLENSVRGLLTRQDDLGRISTYAVETEFSSWDMWCRKYVMLGCQYFLEICRDEALKADVIGALKRHADYIVEHIGDGEGQRSIFTTSNIWGCVNSSSILEPMMRLYQLTGEQRYLDFSTYLVTAGGIDGFNIFEAAYRGDVLPHQYAATKAYEIMSCFEGLLEYYRVTGEEKWKTAVLHFIDQVAESEITIIGSAGCSHELFDHAAVRQCDITEQGPMLETCVTVTWMKLCFKALCLTGDCRYAGHIERAYFNAMLGAVNLENSPENGGMVFDSYSPLHEKTRGRGIGGFKILNGLYFSGCCDSIGATGVGIGGMFAVMQDDEGAVINTFLPGRTVVTHGGNAVTLAVQTAYPAAGNTRIEVTADVPCPMTVKVRVPAFSRQSALTVNGQPVACTAGEYVVITRTWQTGDAIDVSLDMDVRAVTPARYGVGDAALVAYEAGPLVLARDARFGEDITAAVDGLPEAARQVSNACFHSTVCYELPQADGSSIRLADYASCGKTWNADSTLSVWLKTK